MKEAVTDAQQRPGFPLRSLCSLQDGNENRGQLFALLSQRREFFRADDPGFHEQFQPVGAIFNLAKRIAAFRNELSFASRAKRFSVIGADRSSRAEQLLPKRRSLRRFRKRGKHAHNPKRESLRPITQIFFFLLHSSLLLHAASDHLIGLTSGRNPRQLYAIRAMTPFTRRLVS